MTHVTLKDAHILFGYMLSVGGGHTELNRWLLENGVINKDHKRKSIPLSILANFWRYGKNLIVGKGHGRVSRRAIAKIKGNWKPVEIWYP